MVTFVILHYMVKEETINCVKSVMALDGEKSIVIIDNNSPNNSGKLLKKMYINNNDIYVHINDDNVGFAKANNIGCKIAKAKFNPDFYIVMNNDIEIYQNDFIKNIYDIYEKNSFDVLGPDIYASTLKIHQNPKSLQTLTIHEAKRMKGIYEKRIKSKKKLYVKCFMKKIPFIKTIIHKYRRINKRVNYNEKRLNVQLHGACLIFSADFVKKRGNVFFQNTFFYFESEILSYECMLNGFVTLYHPQIKVLHHQNISTNTVYKNEIKKVMFMNQQNYNSICAFLKEYDKGDKNE